MTNVTYALGTNNTIFHSSHFRTSHCYHPFEIEIYDYFILDSPFTHHYLITSHFISSHCFVSYLLIFSIFCNFKTNVILCTVFTNYFWYTFIYHIISNNANITVTWKGGPKTATIHLVLLGISLSLHLEHGIYLMLIAFHYNVYIWCSCWISVQLIYYTNLLELIKQNVNAIFIYHISYISKFVYVLRHVKYIRVIVLHKKVCF